MLGAVNELSDPRDVVLCAAGSMPGDLHKLWRVRDRKALPRRVRLLLHGLRDPGVDRDPAGRRDRDVFAMVGDGGYLMMPTELVTAVQERVKVIVVLVQNHGFHSIGSLSESLGSQRFGTRYRYRDEAAAGSTATGCRSTSPPTPAASAPTSSRCTRRPSSSRRSRTPRPLRPTAGRSSSTSRPTRSCTRPTASAWWDVPVSEVVRAGLDPGRLPDVPVAQGHPTPADHADRRRGPVMSSPSTRTCSGPSRPRSFRASPTSATSVSAVPARPPPLLQPSPDRRRRRCRVPQ